MQSIGEESWRDRPAFDSQLRAETKATPGVEVLLIFHAALSSFLPGVGDPLKFFPWCHLFRVLVSPE